jgi:type I restriction enzyme, S subunit
MQVAQQPRQGYKQTQIGEIPDEWELQRLSMISEVTMGQSPPGDSYNSIGIGTPLLNGPTEFGTEHPAPIQFTTKPTKFCFKGDILLCVRGSTTGRLNLADQKYCLGRGLASIRGLNEKTETKWLYYQFLRMQNTIYNIASGGGSTFPNINGDIIRRIILPYPKFNEQQKIASILSKVDELIQKTDQVVEQTQRLKKGLMQRLLTKGIGHTKFKKTTIGEIPEKWHIMKLGDLLNLCQYGISEKMSAQGQYAIFRMNNIEEGYLVKNEMKFIDLDQQIFEQYKLEKGDLLFNRTNSYDLVGKVGLFNLDGEYTFASYLIRLRTIQEKMNPFFLHLYLNTDWMQHKLKNLATAGVSQVNINATNLKTVKIATPSTSEQERIVSVLYGVEEKLMYEKERKSIIEKIKNGLMQKLLTGKIRVKV